MLKNVLKLIKLDQEKDYFKFIKQDESKKILRSIITTITSGQNIDDVLNNLCNDISCSFNVPIVVITEFINKDDNLNLKIRTNYGTADLSNLEDEGIQQWISLMTEKGNNLIINDIYKSNIPKELKKNCELAGIKSLIGLPIKYEDIFWGSICIAENKDREWTDYESELLKHIANHIYYAIKQVEQHFEIKKWAEREKIIRELSYNVNTCSNIQELKKRIVTEIGKLLSADRVLIREYNSLSGKYYPIDIHSEYLSSNSVKSFLNTDGQEEWLKCFINILQNNGEIIFSDVNKFIRENNLKVTPEEKYLKNYDIKSAIAIPISCKEEYLGSIIIQFTENSYIFTEEDLTFVKTIINYFGIAYYQAKLLEKTKKQTEREALLRRIIETVRNTLEPEEMQQLLVEETGKAFNADKCFILPLDTVNSAFLPIKIKYLSSTKLDQPYHVGNAEEKTVISEYKQGNCFELPDLEYLSYNSENSILKSIGRTLVEHYNIRSNYCYPVVIGGKLLASFAVQYTNKTVLPKEDLEILRAIVAHLAVALKQAELYSETKKQAEREKLLRNITDVIRNSLDINEIKDKFVAEVGKTFKADRCFIGDFDPAEYKFLPIESKYLSSSDMKSAIDYTFYTEMKEYFQYVHTHNQPTIIKDVGALIDKLSPASKVLKKLYNDFGVKSNYGFSITYKEEILGAFVLHYTRETVELSDEDINILTTIANQTAIALKHAELFLETKKQSQREKFLRNVVGNIHNTFDIEETLNHICKEIAVTFNVYRVGIGDFKKKISDKFLLFEYKMQKILRDQKILILIPEFWIIYTPML